MKNRTTMTATQFLALLNSDNGRLKLADGDDDVTVSGNVTFDADNNEAISMHGININCVFFAHHVRVSGRFDFKPLIRFQSCQFNHGLTLENLTARWFELVGGRVVNELGFSYNTNLGQVNIFNTSLDRVHLGGTISRGCVKKLLNVPSTPDLNGHGSLVFTPEALTDRVALDVEHLLIDKVVTSMEVLATQLHLAGIKVIVPHATAANLLR